MTALRLVDNFWAVQNYLVFLVILLSRLFIDNDTVRSNGEEEKEGDGRTGAGVIKININ